MSRCKERGFTLLDALFQLMVVILFVQLFIFFVPWVEQTQTKVSSKSMMEWENFLYELQQEMKGAGQLHITGENISYAYRKDIAIGTYCIRKQNDAISKQICGGGSYVVLLTDIKKIVYRYEYPKLYVKVQFKNNVEKERFIVLPDIENL